MASGGQESWIRRSALPLAPDEVDARGTDRTPPETRQEVGRSDYEAQARADAQTRLFETRECDPAPLREPRGGQAGGGDSGRAALRKLSERPRSRARKATEI